MQQLRIRIKLTGLSNLYCFGLLENNDWATGCRAMSRQSQQPITEQSADRRHDQPAINKQITFATTPILRGWVSLSLNFGLKGYVLRLYPWTV